MKVIKGFEKYLVTEDGRVFAKTKRGIIQMKLNRDRLGYDAVRFYRDGKQYRKPVHRLVYESFIGLIPTGKQINHINGVKHDNRAENLEACTAAENVHHAWRTGLATPHYYPKGVTSASH